MPSIGHENITIVSLMVLKTECMAEKVSFGPVKNVMELLRNLELLCRQL